MSVNPQIFKAYDIRGLYPEEIDGDAAYKIGRAIVKFLKAKNLAVGRDVRKSSQNLFDNLARGAIDEGVNVYDLGLTTTPMVYFAAGKMAVEGAVMITASHNPPDWNGFKICRAGAIPIGLESGLDEIGKMARENIFYDAVFKGRIIPANIKAEYGKHIASFFKPQNRKFKIVFDPANAMSILDIYIYQKFPASLQLLTINNFFDGNFPAHEPNPLKTETLEDLTRKVVENQADLGIASDGDGDRIGFVDEAGQVIPMDLVTALVSRIILKKNPGQLILYDLRSSMSVRETIEANGGRAQECRVGHALIKNQMRQENAVFAGELSGHYYFQENFLAEACPLPAFYLLNLMDESGKKISELVKDVRKYYHSGEINSQVANKEEVLDRLKKIYAEGQQSELDGLKVSFWQSKPGLRWWFNVRPSNTEPVLRLNMEADNPALLESKKTELLNIIRG